MKWEIVTLWDIKLQLWEICNKLNLWGINCSCELQSHSYKKKVANMRYTVRITSKKLTILRNKDAIVRQSCNFDELSCNYEKKVIIVRNKVTVMRNNVVNVK